MGESLQTVRLKIKANKVSKMWTKCAGGEFLSETAIPRDVMAKNYDALVARNTLRCVVVKKLYFDGLE